MKQHKITLIAIAISFIGSLFAQEKKTIKAIVPNKTDEVYITGNQEALGNWTPNQVKMNKVSDYERAITLNLTYPAQFKFTKGDWNSEGILNTLDNNPNVILKNWDSKHIFNIKGWSNDATSQALGLDYTTKQLESKYLEGGRQIKIALPNNYDSSKKYPVFYTTDAGWNLFTVTKDYISVASLDEYKLVPESIVVGIVHGMTNGQSNRNKDLDVYYKKSGQNFKDFVFDELVPYINKTYSTSGFNVMVGHSNGAQYNHYLLLEEDNPFRGFMSFSTNFYGVDFKQEIGEKMKNHQGKKIYYFVANAKQDSPDRIEAGDDYDRIYKANKNPKFQFSKKTYEANHNSVVPLAFLDGLQHIFIDYKNLESYSDFKSYRDNYLIDLKANYGLEENYSLSDLDPILSEIITNKKKEDLVEFFKFVEDYKLWQNPFMKSPAGMDAANKGNMYYFVDAFDRSAKNFAIALEELDISVEPGVYFGNLEKGIRSFKAIKDYEGLMTLYLNTKRYLNSKNSLSQKKIRTYMLYINYEIAKLSKEQNIYTSEGKKALSYCKDNYVKNRYFAYEELEEIL
jgi:predicted alpha/beta superfamily hydrolase